MRPAITTVLVASLLCGTLFGQSPAPAIQAQTFHIKGTITDPIGAVVPGVKVTFQSEHTSRTVAANDTGVYEADLPFGLYTMTAEKYGFRLYRRPPFRVASPTGLTVNIALPVERMIDRIVVNSSGRPLTDEDWETVSKSPQNYYGEEFFPAPSEDGTAFQLYIRYMRREATDGVYTYTGEKTPYNDHVFVAYNLFSLEADHVMYSMKRRMVEASGNVVMVTESGATQCAESITVKIENGQAIPVPQEGVANENPRITPEWRQGTENFPRIEPFSGPI